MNTKISNLSNQMKKSQDMAMETYLAQMLSAKQPVLMAYQRQEITAAEYEEQTGETVAETLAQQFALDHRRQLRQMYDKVEAGYITVQECEQITGLPYDPDAISPLRLMERAKMAVQGASKAPEDTKDTGDAGEDKEAAAGPENVTVDLSSGGEG